MKCSINLLMRSRFFGFLDLGGLELVWSGVELVLLEMILLLH